MVQLTEDFEVADIKLNGREFQDRRENGAKRQNRSIKTKKPGNWKRGIHQRRNKRFAW